MQPHVVYTLLYNRTKAKYSSWSLACVKTAHSVSNALIHTRNDVGIMYAAESDSEGHRLFGKGALACSCKETYPPPTVTISFKSDDVDPGYTNSTHSSFLACLAAAAWKLPRFRYRACTLRVAPCVVGHLMWSCLLEMPVRQCLFRLGRRNVSPFIDGLNATSEKVAAFAP